ncbi:MAG TPA: hypothetical protein VMK42_15860 [Anaeromyxobacteraceae bacterium]|nr:hypothetical protein [Anaeromyxobacteraceae bacterium]
MDRTTSSPTPQSIPRGNPSLPVVGQAKPQKPPYARPIEVGLRSIHIASMALVLGGIPMGGTFETLRVPIVATLASGLLLLAACMRWGCFNLTQGAGWALLLKLGLLGLGNVFEGARLQCYLAATVVASVGSHMTSSWRHFTFPARTIRPAGKSGPRAA